MPLPEALTAAAALQEEHSPPVLKAFPRELVSCLERLQADVDALKAAAPAPPPPPTETPPG